MPSLMTEEFGISLRQLQILFVLWDAGKPIPRKELLSQFHERWEPIEDASLRSHLRTMSAKDLIVRELADREPNTLGRTPTLYSAKPGPEEIISNLFDTLFLDAFGHSAELLEIAIQDLKRRLG